MEVLKVYFIRSRMVGRRGMSSSTDEIAAKERTASAGGGAGRCISKTYVLKQQATRRNGINGEVLEPYGLIL